MAHGSRFVARGPDVFVYSVCYVGISSDSVGPLWDGVSSCLVMYLYPLFEFIDMLRVTLAGIAHDHFEAIGVTKDRWRGETPGGREFSRGILISQKEGYNLSGQNHDGIFMSHMMLEVGEHTAVHVLQCFRWHCLLSLWTTFTCLLN